MATPGEAVVVRLPERFEAFYEREYHRVVGFAYAVAGSWEAAEDATQEAFLRAHRQWERVGRYDQPGAWVRRGGRQPGRLGLPAPAGRGPGAGPPGRPPPARPAAAAGGPGLLAGGAVPAQPPASGRGPVLPGCTAPG